MVLLHHWLQEPLGLACLQLGLFLVGRKQAPGGPCLSALPATLAKDKARTEYTLTQLGYKVTCMATETTNHEQRRLRGLINYRINLVHAQLNFSNVEDSILGAC